MRSLVTGARGFVGSWLLAHLRDEGDEAIGIDHEVDVTDGDAIRDAMVDAAPEVVYHLAAATHVGSSWDDPAFVFRINALGTLYVLQAALSCPKPPRVLVTSSAEVYGSADPSLMPLDEETGLSPVTPYAVSKVSAEFMALQAHMAHGLPVIVARPFNHIGPGQSPTFAIPALAQRIVTARRNGSRNIAVGNLDAKRDLTDVRDVVRAYRLLMERGEPGHIYNVCSGRTLSMSEVARRLMALAESPVEMIVDPALTRPVDVQVMWGSPSKLHSATGWEPTIALDRTLADVLAEFS